MTRRQLQHMLADVQADIAELKELAEWLRNELKANHPPAISTTVRRAVERSVFGVTARQAAKAANCSEVTARKYLRQLCRQGLVVEVHRWPEPYLYRYEPSDSGIQRDQSQSDGSRQGAGAPVPYTGREAPERLRSRGVHPKDQRRKAKHRRRHEA